MKPVAWLGIFVMGLAIAAGCSGGGSNPQDDAFQKSLAEAAAKAKTSPNRRHSLAKAPPMGQAPQATSGTTPGPN
jgi:hypothetical protein